MYATRHTRPIRTGLSALTLGLVLSYTLPLRLSYALALFRVLSRQGDSREATSRTATVRRGH